MNGWLKLKSKSMKKNISTVLSVKLSREEENTRFNHASWFPLFPPYKIKTCFKIFPPTVTCNRIKMTNMGKKEQFENIFISNFTLVFRCQSFPFFWWDAVWGECRDLCKAGRNERPASMECPGNLKPENFIYYDHYWIG